MSAALDNAILEAEREMDIDSCIEDEENGDMIDYVAGLTDHMVESEPDYTEEDIDDDVKDIIDEEE